MDKKDTKHQMIAGGASLPPPASDQTSNGNPHDPDMIRTAGEKVFDEITYRGVDWALNSTIGVAMTYAATATPQGRRFFGQHLVNGWKWLIRPISSPEKLTVYAERLRDFTTIMIGGFSIITIIMGLEKNKKPIVKSLDEKIYGEDAVKNDPRFAAAYEEIGKEKEQGFLVGMVTRVAALVPLIYGHTKFKGTLSRYLYEPIAKMSLWTAETVGIKPKKMLETITIEGEETTKWNFLHNTIGFDFGLCIFYAYLHEFLYKRVANILGDKSENAHSEPMPLNATANPTTFTDESKLSKSEYRAPQSTSTSQPVFPTNPSRKVSAEGIDYHASVTLASDAPHVSMS
jgi:hypothetical protein